MPAKAYNVTLTTDFGSSDWFVGTMKGVISSINSKASVIDLTHEIPSGDIRAGAFALSAAYHFFQRHTIHVTVIDPGVGSARGVIAVQTENYFFVGPDNGVLSWALAKEKILAIRCLENIDFFLSHVSQTFHGRDIFAPVAAHLSRGVSIDKLGPAQSDYVRLPWPKPSRSSDAIHGEVVYVDHFGNAITNISNELLQGFEKTSVVRMGRKSVWPVAPYYQAVPLGKPVAVPGSTGLLEISVNGGNAAAKLALKPGSEICVQLSGAKAPLAEAKRCFR